MGRSGIVLAIVVLIGCVFATSIAKRRTNKLETVIGIDLGTRHSCVGVYKNGSVEIIANDQGNRITPSWVAFTDNERLIGEAAKNQAVVNAERTIFDVKRLIGRKFEDKEVQRDMKMVPYNIVNKDGKPYVQIKLKDGETKVFSPEEISAMVLTKMKETAEAFLGKEVKNVVVTVPAYFNDAQKQATKDAATIVGLNVARIVSEPIAATVAYDLEKKGGEKNILVFELGDGTFDVTIMLIDNGVYEVIATNGEPHLGGDDFDQRIVEYFIKFIKNKHGKDISKDSIALGKLRLEANRAKQALITQDQVHVEIKSLLEDVDLFEPLTRAQFEELNNDVFKKTMEHVNKTIADAGLEKHQIDEIVLVGGGTMIPKVQQLLKDYFDGKEPNKGVNPDEVIAFGAAIQGGVLSGEIKWDETEDLCGDRYFALKILETYVYNMKKQVNDKDKLADKLESDEKEIIESATKEALEWLVDNPLAKRDEYYEKLEDVKDVCDPIIDVVYCRSGGPPDEPTDGAVEDNDDDHDELYSRRWIVLISCLVSIILGYYFMK